MLPPQVFETGKAIQHHATVTPEVFELALAGS
jgi:hypothetical protein